MKNKKIKNEHKNKVSFGLNTLCFGVPLLWSYVNKLGEQGYVRVENDEEMWER